MTLHEELDRQLAELLEQMASQRSPERIFADIRRNEVEIQRDMEALANGRQRWHATLRRRRSARPSKAVVLRCLSTMGVNTDQVHDRPGRKRSAWRSPVNQK